MKVNERTLPIQGFRVLLMNGIVLLHVNYGKPVFGSGEELVSFFFIVSGFLYRDKLPWLKYVKKKAKDLFSVYWIILLLYCIKQYSIGDFTLNWDMLPHVFLLQSWIPASSTEYAFSYVGVAWFLSSLWFCYLCSPLLFNKVKTLTKANSVVLFLMSVIGIIAFYHFEHGWNSLGMWLAYVSPYSRVLEYYMGMLLWKLIGNRKYSQLLLWGGQWTAVLLIGIYIFCIYSRLLAHLTCIMHVLVIGYCYLYSSKFINICFANRVMISLSKYVMFVYLTHQTFIVNFEYLRDITTHYLGIVGFHVNVMYVIGLYCWGFGVAFGVLYNKVKQFCL